jgi:Mrp family chromosome partitioning ATPase
MVTSTASEHGKSSVAVALAESFARQQYRTLLLDADLRKPVLGHEYDLSPFDSPSLREALDDTLASVAPSRVYLSGSVVLDVLASFEAAPNPTELLAERMPVLLDRLRPSYDVIIIDSPPVSPSPTR